MNRGAGKQAGILPAPNPAGTEIEAVPEDKYLIAGNEEGMCVLQL